MTKQLSEVNLKLHLSNTQSGKVGAASRRSFAKHLLATGLFTGLTVSLSPDVFAQSRISGKAPALSAATLPSETTREIRLNTRSRFQERLSDYFQTTDGFGTPISLLLLQINDLPEVKKRIEQSKLSTGEAKKLQEESFALIFRGPRELPLQQKIYTLRHPVMGEVEIFLVPVGRLRAEDAGRDYEAVFNRLLN